MRIVEQPVQFPAKVLIVLYQLLGHAVDTADYGQNPELIANADAAVLSPIAKKGFLLHLGKCIHLVIVAILHTFRKLGLHIVRMNPGAGRNILRRQCNGVPVFDHRAPLWNVTKSCLMSSGHRLPQQDALAGCGNIFPLLHVFQCNYNIIPGMNMYVFHSSLRSCRRSGSASVPLQRPSACRQFTKF